jgi:NAD(P)-dependent dehydrogenase (short-subunit alcohol dehydrogenase family)
MLYPTQPTVVVAGAASGIGRATAQLFAERGARVGLIDQNAVQLDSFVAELRQRGADVRSEACDVRNRQDLEHAMHNLASPDGTIHSLVCAAGVLRTAALADMSEEEYDFVFNINTKAFMLCIQAALPYLAAAGTEVPSSASRLPPGNVRRPEVESTRHRRPPCNILCAGSRSSWPAGTSA